VITSQGPGTALPFALELVRQLAGEEVARKVAEAMLTKL
jgi:4-methyl-5(b-hydroxyethyl)-thiazole monophosphate biosynthesis